MLHGVGGQIVSEVFKDYSALTFKVQLLNLEDEGTPILKNVRNDLPKGTV